MLMLHVDVTFEHLFFYVHMSNLLTSAQGPQHTRGRHLLHSFGLFPFRCRRHDAITKLDLNRCHPLASATIQLCVPEMCIARPAPRPRHRSHQSHVARRSRSIAWRRRRRILHPAPHSTLKSQLCGDLASSRFCHVACCCFGFSGHPSARLCCCRHQVLPSCWLVGPPPLQGQCRVPARSIDEGPLQPRAKTNTTSLSI
jgi:hypothetical protein